MLLKSKIINLNSTINKFAKKISIQNTLKKNVLATILFLVTLHFFYSYLGLYKYLHKRPCSIHCSAQSQRASVALNYYEDDMNFFKPRVQKPILVNGTNRVTGLEFPIIYYIAAVFYKLFGFNELYLKLISLIFCSIGFAFYNLLILKFIKNIILSIAIFFATFLSPVLLYYMPNFMPDAPAFALMMAGWYFFFNYLKTNKISQIRWFVFFGALASLIKATFLIGFVVILCLLVLDYLKFFKTKDKNKIFLNTKKVFLHTVFGIFVVLAWYYYASWLAKANNNETFALQPVIVSDWPTVVKIWETIVNFWLFQYYAYETYVFICAVIIILIIGFKFLNKFLLSITILYVLGSICYVLLFLNQFLWHDYYIISILPCVLFLFLTFADFVRTISDKYSLLILLVLFIAIFFNIKECRIWAKRQYNDRYSEYSINSYSNFRPFEDLESKLRKLGIKREDKTLFAFDLTFCSELYLSNQLGYSFDSAISKENLTSLINNPKFKYLVVNDSVMFNKIYSKNIDDKIISTHRGLIIYKIN